MNVFILTSHAFFEGVEDDRTLGVYRTLARACDVARANDVVAAKTMMNTPNYAIHEWSFPDTYAPAEAQPDGVLVATYHGRWPSNGGHWTRSTRDAQGVWEIHPFAFPGPHGPHEGAAHGGEEAADGRPAAVEPHPHG